VTPQFKDLVGEEGGPQELDRLQRVHDLLVAAGPPPELSPALAEPPPLGKPEEVGLLPKRRRQSTLLVAAAVVALSFGIGYLVGNRGDATPSSRLVAMEGVGALSRAKASVRVGAEDGHGNWPLTLKVTGLRKLPKGSWYELYLTRNGKRTESCGTFNTGAGTTTVRLSVPYSLKDVGWAITAHRPGRPDAADRVLLTTSPA
jgi:hypothetical protein